MKNTNYKETLHRLLEEETPDVLSKIKQDPRFRVPVKEKFSLAAIFRQYKVPYVFSSIFVLALFVFALFLSGQAPGNEVIASTITMDINPALEITLNEDDEVIDVVSINTDGEEFIRNLSNVKGMSLDTVIRVLVQRAIDRGYIIDDTNVILIDIASRNQTLKATLEEKIQTAFQREQMRHNIPVNVRNMVTEITENVRAEAREHHMSGAKYRLIQTVLDASNEYTFEELENYSIRSLFRILNEVHGDETQFPPMGQPGNMPRNGHND